METKKYISQHNDVVVIYTKLTDRETHNDIDI